MIAQNDGPSDPMIYDVIIIGAGPCSLATAARLREQHPSALFTDEEQARYSWISRNTAIKNRHTGKVRKPSCNTKNSRKELSILVLDATGDSWMQRWNRLFERLHIEFLRSPMFFHPDPRDRDALLAYCHALDYHCKGTHSIQEIAGCVGKEISKHKKKQRLACACAKSPRDINERDRQDYFAPSARAFKRFCEECADRYNLGNLVKKGKVLDVAYGMSQTHAPKTFTVTTEDGVYRARTAVLAMGGGEPIVPAPLSLGGPGSISHALDLSDESRLFPSSLQGKIAARRHTNVLVIGGGLTSAQVADCLLRKGIHKVHLIMRGPWKIKAFDVDLQWMGKWRNHQKAEFWSEDDLLERLDMAKAARGGGSITPRYTKVLKEWMKQGRLVVHTHANVCRQQWDETTGTWAIKTEPELQLPGFDHIVLATGLGSDISTLPMLQSIRASHPVESFGGFPALNNSLMWNDEVPLFVTGKMAMLQLGPGAGNLEGARLGAERIAWGINQLLYDVTDDQEHSEDGVDRYIMGIGSKFEGLMDEDSGVEL